MTSVLDFKSPNKKPRRDTHAPIYNDQVLCLFIAEVERMLEFLQSCWTTGIKIPKTESDKMPPALNLARIKYYLA